MKKLGHNPAMGCKNQVKFLLAGALMIAAVATDGAELLAGSASGGRLVLFASDQPEAVMVVKLKGLQTDEEILGLDMRPATGELYALGSSSRLYTIDLENRRAVQVGAGFAPLLQGTTFGFDFNPTVDRIRIVSDSGQNLRAHPDTGAIVSVDGNLAYAAGDPAEGVPPTISAAAYINNDNDPATGTALFDIDIERDTLVLQVNPNGGVLNTIGPLGVDVERVTGFDVAGSDGTAYASLVGADQHGNSARASLYTIDLATGEASLIGKIGGPKPLSSLATLGLIE